jgi:CheY-specific phosphatase CheX
MNAATIERIDAVVETAARSLFAAQGLKLGERSGAFDATPDDHDVAGSIGFTAPEIRGAVLMTARKDVLARAWPAELRHRVPSDRDVYDWTGELVNQLLGRVKNALVPYGLALEQSTPTVVTGWHLHRAPASTNVARRYLFEAAGGSVAVYFDAVIGEAFALSGTPRESLQPVVEGDVQLF